MKKQDELCSGFVIVVLVWYVVTFIVGIFILGDNHPKDEVQRSEMVSEKVEAIKPTILSRP